MIADRRRILGVVLLVALVSAATSWQLARGLQPNISDVVVEATAITVTATVESTVLESSVVSRGTLRIDETTRLTLATEPALSIVTAAPPGSGTTLSEGDVLVELADRPVFVLQGRLPMYRDLLPGAKGEDVAQLEAALIRLGYLSEPATGELSTEVENAIATLYSEAGHSTLTPTPDDLASLAEARAAVDSSRYSLVAAELAKDNASEPPSESARLQQENSVRLAERAVDDAIEARATGAEVAQSAVDSAATEVAAAEAAAAVAEVAAAEAAAQTAADRFTSASNGAHPDTGLPPTESELAELNQAAASTTTRLEEARKAKTTADRQLPEVAALHERELHEREVQDREAELAIRRAKLAEFLEPPDLVGLDRQIAAARQQHDLAVERLVLSESEVGVGFPASELIFVPVLPRPVGAVLVQRGDTLRGPIVELADSSFSLDGSVPIVERQFLDIGLAVVADDESASATFTGTIVEIADSAGTDGVGPDEVYIRIRLDIASGVEAVPASLRVTIPFRLTDVEVLVVPLAAVTTDFDGTTSVERISANGDVEQLTVEIGLRAGGLVEVRSNSLKVGDEVTVGVVGLAPTDA